MTRLKNRPTYSLPENFNIEFIDSRNISKKDLDKKKDFESSLFLILDKEKLDLESATNG